jgi:hydrogenase expression/formation protein HypD
MRFSEEFRDRALVHEIASRIGKHEGISAAIMEVCGTHTMSAARFGLRSLLPAGVTLVSGPGCPVCVTDQRDIDSFLALGSLPSVILTSFGDMLRVPGTRTSLERLRAAGADVRVVYSPMDAVDIARGNPASRVVFFGVGFETTMPATALAVKVAADDGIGNFSMFCCHKTIPAALRALLSAGEVKVSGLLLPGHVTTIIGARSYDFIPTEFGVPCAVTGFEPVDMMLGIESILRQIEERAPRVDNVYSRAVRSEPNAQAAELLSEVFVTADASWRGIGVIAGSGVEIAPEYAHVDAGKRFADAIASVEPPAPTPCRCGEVLRGVMRPVDCPLFGTACTPSEPVGPCMVSSEGACAAAFKYGGFS